MKFSHCLNFGQANNNGLISINDLEKITPAKLNIPCFLMCLPYYVDNKIANNKWITDMTEEERKIDKEKFLLQWFDFYSVLSGQSIVLLLQPHPDLQDLVYVNSGAYLPHYKEKDIVILSNFTAEGRAGEEIVLGDFLTKLGYQCIKSPYKFEGEPELKWLRENIYFGGYGIRSDIKTHEWIEREFGAKIIKCEETNEYLYHLDCSIFVLDEHNIICYTKHFDSKTIKEIEKVANIYDVDESDALMGICNSVKCRQTVFNASSLHNMKKTDKYYEEERKKNEKLVKICKKVGLEVYFFDMSEAMKSGALLSCFVMHLNYA